MDPMLFLNMAFQYAALNNFALMLEREAQGTCTHTISDPEAGYNYDMAKQSGGNPRYVCHSEYGHFVIHTFKDDEEEGDPGMLMVCWAEMGPEAFNKTACQWWKDQGADPDKYAPGVTDLHLNHESYAEEAEKSANTVTTDWSTPKLNCPRCGKPLNELGMLTPDGLVHEACYSTKPEPPPRPSREDAIEFITKLSAFNPTGDPHGAIDPQFTKACRDYDPKRKPEKELTLEEWKTLRDNNVGDAFARDIGDAIDPFVFLVVLRDRLVFAGGCSDLVIRLINVIVDPHIVPGRLEWVS